ncbi:MAG TPA: hypothetical protein VFR12_10655 [Pyrinomonadaceae bacterium]|nr:hypothetical protein [Pyrinomonadaceae bacterium]
MHQAVKSLVAKWSSLIPSVFLITLLLVVVFADSGPAARSASAEDELRIELTGNGFVPSEVQHAAGTFGIAVENSTLSGAYVLRLKSEDGTVLKEVEVQKGSAAWTVSLQPGQYTLTEASHPQWLCRITVQ